MHNWKGTCAFSTLFLRLSWPDPMVRLIAANQIAKRLSEEPDKTLPIFMDWMRLRDLEVEVANGMAILRLSGVFSDVDYDELFSAVSAGSVLTHALLKDMFEHSEEDYEWVNNHSGPFDKDYSEDSDFHHTWERQPLWGVHAFKDLAEKKGFPLKQQWAFEWQKIVEKGYPRSFGDHHFRPSTVQKCKAHLTPMALDVSLSSFLKTLSFAIEHWGMPVSFACELAKEILPIYEDVFMPISGTCPNGWGESTDDIPKALFQIISENPELVCVSAPWSWSWEEGPIIDVSVKALCISSDTSTDASEELWDATEHFHSAEGDQLIPEMSQSIPSNIYEKYIEKTSQKKLFPMVAQWRPDSLPLLTLPQMLRGHFLPMISSGVGQLQLDPTSSGTEYLINGTTVGRQEFWLRNWLPSFIIDSAPRVGTSVFISTEFVREQVSRKGMELKYLFKITTADRENGYGDFKESKKYGFL